MIVTLTGTMGLPEFNGLAGPGTLVRYGDDSNNCAAMKLQFDTGRGTTMRLSQLGVTPAQITAVFFTHMHSDHVDGFADLMQLRWHFDFKRTESRRRVHVRHRISARLHDQLPEIHCPSCRL